jgi:hypothetical protein
MERRLDKIDPLGMRDRLKRKFDMLEGKEQELLGLQKNEFLGESN